MKMKINSHMHSQSHDDNAKPLIEETVKQAIAKKLSHIYITDHYPLPNQKFENLFTEEYFKEFNRVKNKFNADIYVGLGVEMGWNRNSEWTKRELEKHDYDYVIGSIHVIYDETGKFWMFDCPEEKYREGIKVFGGIKNFVKEYFKQMKLIIKAGLYDCVGHLDLIKIQNKTIPLFSEKDSWYNEEVLKVLDMIKKEKMCIEINSSGIRKKAKEQYPSEWILEEIKKRNIPITLGTDGHYPADVDKDLDKIIDLVKKLNYGNIVIFKKRKMIKVKIS